MRPLNALGARCGRQAGKGSEGCERGARPELPLALDEPVARAADRQEVPNDAEHKVVGRPGSAPEAAPARLTQSAPGCPSASQKRWRSKSRLSCRRSSSGRRRPAHRRDGPAPQPRGRAAATKGAARRRTPPRNAARVLSGVPPEVAGAHPAAAHGDVRARLPRPSPGTDAPSGGRDHPARVPATADPPAPRNTTRSDPARRERGTPASIHVRISGSPRSAKRVHRVAHFPSRFPLRLPLALLGTPPLTF